MVFSKLTYYKAVRVGCVYYCSTSSTYYTAVRVGWGGNMGPVRNPVL
jgi:hypothetical protein